MDVELFEQMAQVEEHHWWFRGRRRIVHHLVRALQLEPGSLIVDAGCGTGANAASLPSDYQVLGLDPTPVAVERARRFQAPHLTFQCGTLQEVMERSPRPADLVMLLDVIEHVPDDAGLVRGAVASLRPGGHLLVTVPAGMELWSPHDEVFGHFRRYDRSGLAAVFSGLDTETRLLSHFNRRLYPVIRAVRWVRRARGGQTDAAADPLKGSDLRTYPRFVNAALENLFAGEGRRLAKVLAGEARPYPRGASLVALVRRRRE